jgi:mannitol 2-dehydrogenase
MMVVGGSSIKLEDGNLTKLQSDIHTPVYDRRQLKRHTVHIGVGGFHRAHQAVYLDDLLAFEGAERWGE